MSKSKFEGYDVVAQYGDFLVVFAPRSSLYNRTPLRDLHEIAALCHTGKRWVVNFGYWAIHPLEDATTLVESILHFQKITKPREGGLYLIVEQYKDFSEIRLGKEDKDE